MENNDDNKTTSYGNSDINKTETYQNSENQKTTAYQINQKTTAVYHDLQDRGSKSKTHGIGVGDKLTLKDNEEYTIKGIISEGTGEAVIYKVENSNQKTFTLKLYFKFNNPKEEPNVETLNRIKNITDPDILKLYDFGVGADKYQGKYCYEISDFAEGGDLFAVANFKEKYTKDFIENNIVPEILNGIGKLHKFKIYHCDLKPSNIFFKDSNQTDLLIGDYGSAKAFDIETLSEIRKTSTIKGTEAYLAPEQLRGIISEKNDYYSLGIILLHLLYPEQFASDNNMRQVDKQKFEKIVERQYNSRPVVDFNPSYKRLNNLIEGLTIINHINRFGKYEVEKWLKGEEVEVKYITTEISAIQPVKLGYKTIKTDKDLIEVLETRETWWEELFEDEDTYAALKAWIGSYQDISSRKIFDEMIKFYKPFGKDYVKESALRYFDPEREIRIDNHSFNFFTSDNIMNEIEAFIYMLDDIWKITSIEKLRFYFFQFEFLLLQLRKSSNNETKLYFNSLIEKIYAVFGIIQKPIDDLKTEIPTRISSKNEEATYRFLINLFYGFNPKRTFKDSKNQSQRTLDDLGIFFVQNEKAFHDKYLRIEKEIFLQKLNNSKLNSLSRIQFIFHVFKSETNIYIRFKQHEIISHNKCKVYFEYSESLNHFLHFKKIYYKLVSDTHTLDFVTLRYGIFTRPDSFFKSFIHEFKTKLNLTYRELNKIELFAFKKDFNKEYKLAFKVRKIFTIIPCSFLFGLGFYYFIQYLCNRFFLLSDGINPYWSYPFFFITALAFSFLAYGLIWYGVVKKKYFGLYISMFLFISTSVFVLYNISLFYQSKEFQHKCYVESFDPIVTNNIKKIQLYEMLNLLKSRFSITDKTNYIERINFLEKGENIILNSNIPLVRVNFFDPGWLEEWRIIADEVSYGSNIANYLKCNLYSIEETQFKKSFSVTLVANLIEYNSSVGIIIDKKVTLLTRDEITMYTEEDFSDKAKKKVSKEYWFYAIVGENREKGYLESRFIGYNDPHFQGILRWDYSPYGISFIQKPVKYEDAKILDGLERVNLTIHVSNENFQILVNGKVIQNRVENINNPEIGLVFGFKSKLEIKSIVINEIYDDRHKESNDFTLLKPYISNTNSASSFYTDKTMKEQYTADQYENFELLYPDGDFIRIKSQRTNKLLYVREEDCNNIEFFKK